MWDILLVSPVLGYRFSAWFLFLCYSIYSAKLGMPTHLFFCFFFQVQLSYCFSSYCREKLDQVDDSYSITLSIFVLWNWFRSEHNCHILWVSSSNSLWHNGGCLRNLGIHFLPLGSSGYSCWKKLEWYSKQSVPCQDHSSPYTCEKVVPDTICNLLDGWSATIWQHIY